jgi:hypothetical protein
VGGGWTCQRCGRRFGRPRQSHTCAPALSVEEYFATGPESERPIYEAVVAHLEQLGPLVVEAVQVGILFKRARTFAELRPRRDRVVLSLLLPRDLADRRVSRTLPVGRRFAHFVELRAAGEVDEVVRGWLTEAYLSSPG